MASLDSEGIRKRLLAYMNYAVYFPIRSFLFHSLQQANHYFYGAKLIQLLCFFYFLRMARLFCCKFSKTKMWAVLGLRLFNFAAIWPVFPLSCVPNRPRNSTDSEIKLD